MPIAKTAIDPKATSYYSNYFGDYGRAFTKTIIKRVAQLIEADAQILRAEVFPTMGVPLIEHDRVTVEGRARIVTKEASRVDLWHAAFDHNGNVLEFRTFAGPKVTFDSAPAADRS